MSCPAGLRTDIKDENRCIPCEKGTYNHGNMPPLLTFCYKIFDDAVFVYLNATDVQCKKHWVGIPFYEDGEYEGGCVDNDPTTVPIVIPSPYEKLTKTPFSKIPTGFPSTTFPSRRPSKLPTMYPSSKYPTYFPSSPPSFFPSRKPSKFPTNFPSLYPTFSPSSMPTFLCNLNPEHKLPKECMLCIEDLYNITIFPTEMPTPLPSREPSIKEVIKTDILPWMLFGGLLFIQCFCAFVLWGRQRRHRPLLQDQVNEIALVAMQTENDRVTQNLPRNDSLGNVSIGIDSN